ncbi:hypothetical protein HDU87_006183 [Geranomyces variabilis]|uniref:Ribosomal L1 domain-containing protein 1 n=1 Tax=Geranomyces variabilis TaxID=109894 RepID=A0AAD5THF6_9FUNG|nr:hypothetical protein HDU87_006183 [Geranomyces variabilis]
MPGMAKKAATTTTTTTTTIKSTARSTMAATATAAAAIKAEPKATAAAQPTGLSISTVQKAVEALMAHNKQWAKTHASNDLLAQQDPSVQHVDLIITTKTMPDSNKSQLRSTPIPLCRSLYTGADVLLITKDPQREYKDLLEAQGIKGISKVMDYSHLRAKFKTYEARRQLAASYDLFLADERVLALLPKVLGKTFFQKKLLPVPIDMTKSDLQLRIRRVLKGTFLRRTHGVCTSVRIGSTAMGAQCVIDNILKATPHIFKHIPGGWNNIRSVQIKTSKSAALPLLVSLPAPPGEQQDKMVFSFGGDADEDDEVDPDAGEVEPDSDDSDAEEGAKKTQKKVVSSAAAAVQGVVADTVSEVLSSLAAATAEATGENKKPTKSSIRKKKLLAARKNEKYRLRFEERRAAKRAAKLSAEPSSAEESSTEEASKSVKEAPMVEEKKAAAIKPATDSVKTPAKTPMKTRAASTKKSAKKAADTAAPATPTPAAPATPAPATPTPAAAAVIPAEKKTPVKKTPTKTTTAGAAKTPSGTPMKTRSASAKKSAKK